MDNGNFGYITKWRGKKKRKEKKSLIHNAWCIDFRHWVRVNLTQQPFIMYIHSTPYRTLISYYPCATSLATNCVGTKVYPQPSICVCSGTLSREGKSCGDIAHNKAQEVVGTWRPPTHTYVRTKQKGTLKFVISNPINGCSQWH
jgi:hypothetical protein